jgi:hypothetical protein
MKTKRFLLMVSILTVIAMTLSLAACRSSDETELPDPLAGEILSYEAAERALAENGMSGYSALAGLWNSQISNPNTGSKLSLTITPDEYINNLTGSVLKPTTIDLGIALGSAGKAYYGLSYKNGGNEVLSLDFWLDGGNAVVSIPQILDKHLSLPEGLFSSLFGTSDMLESLAPDISGIPAFPTDAVIQSLLDVVLDEYFKIIEGVELTEGVNITVGGRDLVSNKSEIGLTEKDVLTIMLATLKEINANSEIKDFLKEIINMSDPSGMMAMFFNVDTILDLSISQTEASLQSANDSDVVLKMTAYVVGSMVVKREITVPGESGKLTVQSFESKGEYFLDIDFNDGGNHIRISDKGTIRNNARTGEAEISVKFDFFMQTFNQSARATYKDLTMNDKHEITSGDLTLNIPDIPTFGDVELKMTFSNNSFVGSMSAGGIRVGKAELSWDDSYTGKPAPSLTVDNSVTLDSLASIMELNLVEIMLKIGQVTGSLEDDLFTSFILPKLMEELGPMGDMLDMMNGFGGLGGLGDLPGMPDIFDFSN